MASLIGDFNQQHFTDAGVPASGYRLYTYAALTTTLKVAFTDEDGLIPHVYTPDLFGGQYIALNSRGELDAPLMGDGAYDIALKRPNGSDVWTRRVVAGEVVASALVADLGNGSDTSKGDAIIVVKTEIAGSVVTNMHDWNEAQTLNTKANFSIPADGTNQTAALLSLLTTLSAYRGTLIVSQGTVFDEWTLILAIPDGMQLRFRTTWPDGSYKQKFDMVVNGGDVDDDSAQIAVDNYHSAVMQLNTGSKTTNKNDSAARRFVSDYQTIGRTPDFNGLIHGLSRQRAKSPDRNVWSETVYLHTPLSVGMAETHGKWVAGQLMVAGERVRNSVGYVYESLTSTVCGATEPTGTGASISDGTTTWGFVQYTSEPRLRIASTYYGVGAHFFADNYKIYRVTTAGISASGVGPTGTGSGIADGSLVCAYVQAALDIQRTVYRLEEDGKLMLYAPAGTPQRSTFVSGVRKCYLEVDDVTGDVALVDETRGLDIVRGSTTAGLRLGRIQSMANTTTTITASGSIAVTSAISYLATTGGPWEITDITLPAGQTSGRVTLWFANASLVLKNNASIVTRTGADIISAANMMVTLYKDAALSSAWVVWAKN